VTVNQLSLSREEARFEIRTVTLSAKPEAAVLFHPRDDAVATADCLTRRAAL